jgi:hypothetical protein
MIHDRHVYGKIDGEAGMRQVFADPRHDVANAGARPALTELNKRTQNAFSYAQSRPHLSVTNR